MEKELTSDKIDGCSLLCDPVSNTLKAKGESHMCIGQEVCSNSYENGKLCDCIWQLKLVSKD